MKFIAIIPARYASTRFEGKPLADLGGQTVIERCYRRVASVVETVAVATDDRRIFEAVESFGGVAVMTSTSHRSGTDRCLKAFEKLGVDADIIINVQGDEPFIDPEQIRQLMGCFDSPETEIATLALPYPKDGDYAGLDNPNRPKVVFDNNNNALLFSRSVIPFMRGVEKEKWPSSGNYYTHIGMYAFRASVLMQICKLPQSRLELAESLEQLRWLENGYKIKVGITDRQTIGIDTPADLEEARKILAISELRTTPPPISGFKQLSLPEFNRFVLPNGVALNFLNLGEEPVSRMAVIWNVGTLDVASPSTLSMMSLMFQEGIEGLSGQQISDTIEGSGAWLKIVETPHALMAILHSINHTADTVFPLFARILTSPTFPTEALETLKQKSAADKRIAMERPALRAAMASRKALYGADTPMGKVITPESIMEVNRNDMVDLHRNLCLSLRPEIFIAGKITDNLLGIVKEVFGKISFDTENPASVKFTKVTKPLVKSLEEIKVEMPESLQTAIKYDIPTIPQEHPDFEALRMAVMILGGYFGSRLMKNLREDHGYTYGVSAQVVMQADAASISITCDCDNRYANDCLLEINKEISRMASEPVDPDELETARQVVFSFLSGILDSAITVEAYREMMAAYRQPTDALAKRFEAVSKLTPADIMDATRKYLWGNPGVIALAGGKNSNE